MSETVWLGIEQRKWLEVHPYLADEDDVRSLLANTARLEKELWQNVEVYKADMAWAREDYEKLKAEISSFDGSAREPGAVCPACGEKKPSEAALKMREWRAKR